MVAKVEVRNRLASYEILIKEEIKKIEDEIKEMDDQCATEAIKVIWRASAEYSALHSRWSALREVSRGILDIRCEDFLNDYKE